MGGGEEGSGSGLEYVIGGCFVTRSLSTVGFGSGSSVISATGGPVVRSGGLFVSWGGLDVTGSAGNVSVSVSPGNGDVAVGFEGMLLGILWSGGADSVSSGMSSVRVPGSGGSLIGSLMAEVVGGKMVLSGGRVGSEEITGKVSSSGPGSTAEGSSVGPEDPS